LEHRGDQALGAVRVERKFSGRKSLFLQTRKQISQAPLETLFGAKKTLTDTGPKGDHF